MSPLTTSSVSSTSGTNRSAPAVPSGSDSHCQWTSRPGRDRLRLREVGLDQLAQMADADVDALRAAARQPAEDQLQDRAVADRHQRLGQDRRVRPQPRAEPTGQDGGSHRPPGAAPSGRAGPPSDRSTGVLQGAVAMLVVAQPLDRPLQTRRAGRPRAPSRSARVAREWSQSSRGTSLAAGRTRSGSSSGSSSARSARRSAPPARRSRRRAPLPELERLAERPRRRRRSPSGRRRCRSTNVRSRRGSSDPSRSRAAVAAPG